MTEVLRCSFCKKTEHDVRKLIAGPEVFICDECVEVCVDIILDDSRFTGGTASSSLDAKQLSLATKLNRSPGKCSLCDKPAQTDNLLPIGARGLLCGDCADAIEDVLSRGRPIE